MLASRQISLTIARPAHDIYEAIWRPPMFAKWASGLSKAELTPDGDSWTGHGEQGPIRVRFTPHNPYGVMDHWVEAGDAKIYIPLRLIANQDGAEVILTLFRQPDMTDARFAQDGEWVGRDLVALKKLAEQSVAGEKVS